eukprot:gene8554-10891_t
MTALMSSRTSSFAAAVGSYRTRRTALALLASLGRAFVKTRNLPLIYLLPLAAIGLLERYGLREHAQAAIARVKSATAGRILIVYLTVRELSAAGGGQLAHRQ